MVDPLVQLRAHIVRFLGLVLLLTSCSRGPGLTEGEFARANEAVNELAAQAGIHLTEPDTKCVVDHSSTSQGAQLLGLAEQSDGLVDLPDGLDIALADSILSCLGKDSIVRSGLVVFTGEISEESERCVGEAFDHSLLRDLIAARLVGQNRNATAVEIEIGLVLGICLSPNELLVLHGS